MSETLPDAPAIIEAAPQPAEAPAGDMRDTMAAVLAKYPDRDEGGRFESRAPAAAPELETTPDQPETPAEEPASPAIAPPASWSADQAAKWATLPPDVQAYVAQRESEAHKAISEKGARAAMYDAVEAAVGDRKTMLIHNYGSVERGIDTLLNIAMNAGQRPAEFIQSFAQQHRIDLSQLAKPAGNPAAHGDPQIQHLSQTVDSLQAQLQQQEQARAEAALSAQIREFSEAKGADGKALRPHFDAVRGEMAAFMQAGVVKSLDEAYTKAVRANDAVWAQVQAEQSAARQASEQAKAAKIAADARKAASVNIRPVGSVAGSPVRGQTMRDTMAAVAKQMMG